MKLLNFTKKSKNNTPQSIRRKHYVGSSASVPSSSQTRESQLLLDKIKDRKRGVINSRIVFRKKHGIFRKIIFLIILLCAFFYLVYRFKLIDLLKVSEVEVSGAGQYVNFEDVKSVAERNSLGQFIFVIKREDILNTLKNTFLGARNFEIEKEFPNVLKITVEERIPLAVVHDKEDENFLIDSEGYVLGVVEESFSDLPKINYEGHVEVGAFLEKEIIPISIEIITFANQEELKVSSMSFYPSHARVYVNRDTEVLLSYDKENEKSLRTISALVKSSVSEGKILKKIDLRYDKVIVLYD